ncbi:hypothetical protein QFZ96_002139 [Paraburkholderia youngii]
MSLRANSISRPTLRRRPIAIRAYCSECETLKSSRPPDPPCIDNRDGAVRRCLARNAIHWPPNLFVPRATDAARRAPPHTQRIVAASEARDLRTLIVRKRSECGTIEHDAKIEADAKYFNICCGGTRWSELVHIESRRCRDYHQFTPLVTVTGSSCAIMLREEQRCSSPSRLLRMDVTDQFIE